MKREFLQSLELSEEVINQIMAEHGKTVQATQEKLSAAEAQLNEANATLATLKKNNKDNEELQSELKSYKERVETLEQEAKDNARKQTIKDALTAAKGTDVDYLMFKLGDLEVDDEGNVKDLENKIKDLKASLPTFFEQSSEPPKEPEGFTKLGGAGLGGGKTPQETSLESILANPEANLTQFLQQQNK
ncbi:phage scaffolding protein [Streptococcus equinus]|uniref:phage scaffolding protein n=1 Tax=Streptococcus equinus TaxID=1335 RepID=UPI003BF8753F